MELILWSSVLLCLVQSGIFSGLNLALFGLSRVQLEVEAQAGNSDAVTILELREDANGLLTTILWGNVGVNCLLTVLLDSVLAGAVAFVISTFGITLFGEIGPQAYFSRNALRVGAALAPLVRFYRILLYPVAKPSAVLLDRWLGEEVTHWIQEHDLRDLIRSHMDSPDADLGHVEGVGALNFLALDDRRLAEESHTLDPRSVITLPRGESGLVFPQVYSDPEDAFLRTVHASGQKWVVLLGPEGEPEWVLEAHGFLRSALLDGGPPSPRDFCHRPIVIRDAEATVEMALKALHADSSTTPGDLIDRDVVLLWGADRRIVTGSDLFGRLLRGVAYREPLPAADRSDPDPRATAVAPKS
jgi:metal transporter CNNM